MSDTPDSLESPDHVGITGAICPAGSYLVNLSFDDGCRVWIDDKIVFDGWDAEKPQLIAAYCRVTDGEHSIHVEYYDRTGNADLFLWLRPAERRRP